MSGNWKSSGDGWDAPPANDNWNGGTDTNGDTWNDGHVNTADTNGGFDSFNTEGNQENAQFNNDADSSCRNCGQEGHFARDCPEPRKQGPCFNCGEEGHSKIDCTKPRVFRGTCNICNEEGHPAARCPSKPKECTRCKAKDDHDTKDCTNNFNFNMDNVEDMSEGAAWSKIVDASRDADIDDFKDALRMLQKAAPELTYPAVEKKLRAQRLKFYLIALKKEVSDGYTFVNLQGEPDKTYCIAIFRSAECQRPNMVDKWPGSPEENMKRLADSGVAMERGLPYCRICEKFGHSMRSCDQEKTEGPAVQIQCHLCGEIGHRVRDCTEPRQKPRAPRQCKICESEDHIAKDCDQKPVMKCRNCDQEGHKSADCDQPRKLKCSNCDEDGHHRRECTKPTDWSRVTCRHCGEKGHMSESRCAPGAAKKHDDDSNNNDTAAPAENTNTNGGEWGNSNAASTGGGWDDGAPAQSAAAQGGW